MKTVITKISVLIMASFVKCTIDGLTYTDQFNMGKHRSYPVDGDPCNPLYWYPRQLPDYCVQEKFAEPPKPQPAPAPAPMPVLVPVPLPLAPAYPAMPPPAARPPMQAGLVPGVPGLVTSDGGINVLPFSDVYADLIEKRKRKIVRRKLRRLLADHEDCPRSRSRRRRARERLRDIRYE